MKSPLRPMAFSVLSRVGLSGPFLVLGIQTAGRPAFGCEGGVLSVTSPWAGVKILDCGGHCLVSDLGSASSLLCDPVLSCFRVSLPISKMGIITVAAV